MEINVDSLPDYVKRMVEEHNQLNERYLKAIEFMKSKTFEEMDQYSKTLLSIQVSSMASYDQVLILRINNEVSKLTKGK